MTRRFKIEIEVETSANSNSDAISRVEIALQQAVQRGPLDVQPYIVRVRNAQEMER